MARRDASGAFSPVCGIWAHIGPVDVWAALDGRLLGFCLACRLAVVQTDGRWRDLLRVTAQLEAP